MENFKSQPDPTEQALALLETSNQEFENHPLWRQMGVKPGVFFQAFEKYLKTLPIPRDKWQRALDHAREINRIQSKEKKEKINPLNLQMLAGVQV